MERLRDFKYLYSYRYSIHANCSYRNVSLLVINSLKSIIIDPSFYWSFQCAFTPRFVHFLSVSGTVINHIRSFLKSADFESPRPIPSDYSFGIVRRYLPVMVAIASLYYHYHRIKVGGCYKVLRERIVYIRGANVSYEVFILSFVNKLAGTKCTLYFSG